MKEEIDLKVDKDPGNRSKKKCEQPPLALTDLQSYESARRADGKTEQPDRYEPCERPYEDIGSAAINHQLRVAPTPTPPSRPHGLYVH